MPPVALTMAGICLRQTAVACICVRPAVPQMAARPLRRPGRTGDISSKPDTCPAPCGCCQGGPPRCRAGTRRTGRCGRAYGRRSPSRMLAIGACTERAQLPRYAAA
jgi:hypothetical protein